MSGFYLLALIAIWLFVGWVICRLWRRWEPQSMSRKILYIVVGVLLISIWFGGAFWQVAGKKMYWDAKVRELCALDGGLKIYETVELPAEMFDKFEVVYVPKKIKSNSKDEYYYEWDVIYYRRGNPEVWRNYFKIIRKKDMSLLGEGISYGRRGGDFPGPWHASSYGCPADGDISLLKKRVFTKQQTN